MAAPLALPAVLLATVVPFHATSRPLSAPVRSELRAGGFWQPGCPVGLSDLRMLTVTHWDFAGRARTGRLIVNRKAVGPLTGVFRELHRLRFPIRHLSIADVYGPVKGRPKDGDLSGSFECRQAVPSPCTGGTANGSWSNHAYGLAVDLNPVENPYVGCGVTYSGRGRRYLDRSVHRKGMVTKLVIAAFRRAGWGWGGAWAGSTKDYMHFSVTGH